MGIRIAFTNPRYLIARCETASCEASPGAPGLDRDAVVPGGRWTPLTAAGAEPLRATAEDHPATVIEVARFAPQLTDRHTVRFLASADNPPGQPTTTIDHSRSLRLGVHLDNFDKLPLATRSTSRRRLGFNVGPGTRYLLLGTASIFDICQTAGISDPRYCPHTDDIRRHVAGTHPLQLLRLRLDPGDAYIAPTELIPHDGSTLAAEEPSRISFWLGHWPTRTVESLILTTQRTRLARYTTDRDDRTRETPCPWVAGTVPPAAAPTAPL